VPTDAVPTDAVPADDAEAVLPDDATPTTTTGPLDPADGGPIDIFATHDPVAAAELREVLPDRIRQTNSGHLHTQNDTADIQDGTTIDLVEGSSGAGGLDNIVRGDDRPSIDFSIESVGADCQFTRVLRFQIRTASPTGTTVADNTTAQAYGDDVTAETVYFRPQDVAEGRTCGTELGIGPARPWSE
jgi:hypothetical protein